MVRIFYLFFFIAVIIGCNRQESELDKLIDELGSMTIESDSFVKLLEYSDEIRESKSSKELTKIAINIYYRIGNPSFQQDREILYIAISFLDKALVLKPNNRIALENKIHFLNVLGDFDESLNTINLWISSQKPTYRDYMRKALIFEALNFKDSSEVYFRHAKEQHIKTRFRRRDIEDKAHLAIIKAFLYGKDAGLDEIQKLIEKTNHPTAHQFKVMFLDDFNRVEYIKHFVKGKPIIETTIKLRNDSIIIINKQDTTVSFRK